MPNLLDLIQCPGARLIDELSKTINELNEWIDDTGELASAPVASFTYTGNYACIQIGDICVWDTGDTGETFATDDCKKEYLDYVSNLGQFLGSGDVEVKTAEEYEI